MTPLIVALQVATPMMQAPGPPEAAPAPVPATPPTSAPPANAPTWDRPHWQGPPQPAVAPPQPGPPPPIVERTVSWWARFELGFGTYGFAENNQLLTEMGYGGVKTWATLDVAWMFHERVGAGLMLGMNRRSSQPDNAANLNVASYFAVAEIPILLGGNRVWAFYLTPRGGYAAADLEFDNDVPTPLQHTGTFGGALSFQSFAYHFGSSIGFMHTPTGALGELGRGMDFGGLYFTLGATIDG